MKILFLWILEIRFHILQNDGFVDWVKIASNKTKASIIPKKAGKYSYSVSVSSGDVSYGSHWQHCVYTKDVCKYVRTHKIKLGRPYFNDH